MTLGGDVRQAYIDVGTSYSVITSGEAPVSGEYLIFDVPDQVVRPFPREFLLEASLPYNTTANEGDLLYFSDGRKFMLLSKIGVQFENANYEYTCQIVKCNVTNGRVLRSTTETWDVNSYHKVPVWSVIHEGVVAVLTEALVGNILDDREEAAYLSTKNLELYISDTSYDLQVMDRFQPVSGESYRVDSIRKRVFPNVILAQLTEDTRE